MKVLIYSANFAPEPVGIGKYSGELAAWLASRGYEVRVVAAPPYYPEWKLRSEYRWPPYRRERWQGVSVWRAPLWVPDSPGGLKRTLHLLSFALTSAPLMLRQMFWRADAVIVVAPAFVCAPLGWLTARACGAKAWLHLQDFEIDIAFQMGLFKSGGLLQKFSLALERWTMRRFDVVSSISRRMVDRLVQKGVARANTRYFPNWVDVSSIHPQGNGDAYRRELGIADDAVVVLYSGSLGAKHGLMIIPSVAKALAQRQDLVFVICGQGVMKAQLEAATADLPNVRHLPLQPIEKLGQLLCMADIHLLPQTGDASDLVLPSKLAGMLASSRPVIATSSAGTEIANVVSRCGLVVPPNDEQALAAAILQLAQDPISRLTLGRNGRLWAEEHVERDSILSRLFGPFANSRPVSPVANQNYTFDARGRVDEQSQA